MSAKHSKKSTTQHDQDDWTAATDDVEWTDPNLTEPKLQDEFNLPSPAGGMRRRQHQARPQAARRQADPVVQIRYFKYIPYSDMSEPERRKYLNLGPARLTSSRTEPPPPPAARRSTAGRQSRQNDKSRATTAAFWQSGSRSRSLKAYDYHLAELSMAYRSSPALLNQPRRFTPPPSMTQQQQRSPKGPSSLFYQLHARGTLPATAPSATHQVLEKTTQAPPDATPVPFVESALSGEFNYPAEPRDVVSKSASNRLLNVVSVDECHVRHRRRRRRLRRLKNVEVREEPGAEKVGEDEEEEEEEEVDDDAEYDEAEQGDWEDGLEEPDQEEEEANGKTVTAGRSGGEHEVPEPLSHHQEAPPASEADDRRVQLADPTLLSLASTTRPTTEASTRRKVSKRRTEQEMRRLAAAKFVRRNGLLREKMAIYLDWKLDQERFAREVATTVGGAELLGPAGSNLESHWQLLAELREGDPAGRFERFTVDLVHQEALVANQYRDGHSGSSDAMMADQLATASTGDNPEAEDSSQRQQQQHEHHHRRQHQHRHKKQQEKQGPQQQSNDDEGDKTGELSLTEMYEALNA